MSRVLGENLGIFPAGGEGQAHPDAYRIQGVVLRAVDGIEGRQVQIHPSGDRMTQADGRRALVGAIPPTVLENHFGEGE